MNDPVMHNDSSQERNSSSFTAPTRTSRFDTSLIIYTVLAIGAALCIRYFIAAPYIVQGASMEPTFYDYHYVIIDKVSYRVSEPERGDVVVLDLPQDTSRALIKRVVGLPGETISVENSRVVIKNAVHPDGFVLDESYVAATSIGGPTGMTVTLGEDQFFVLGDNRRVSSDSRSWGTLPREDIEGRVLVRLYPLTHIGLFPGAVRFQE